MWDDYLRWTKKKGCWKGSRKEDTIICVQNLMYVVDKKKKRTLLIWNRENKNKNEPVVILT